MFFKKYYFELDFVRALAISMVMAFHIKGIAFSLLAENYLTKAFEWGWHGVDLFFALSGFLIGGQIIEENISGTFSFKRFYLKRFWRIVPPYYAAVVAAFIFSLVLNRDFWLVIEYLYKDIFYHLVYLQNYFTPILNGGLFWSIAVEEQFYIISPILIFLLTRYLRNLVPVVLALLIFLGVLIRFILYDPSKGWWISFFAPFHTRFDNLLFGVLAAFLFIKYKDTLENNSFIWRITLLFITATALGISFFYGNFGGGYFNTCWQFTLTGLGFSAFILYLAAYPISFSVPFLLRSAVKKVAKFSYTMYLYHLIILAATEYLLKRYLGFYKTSLAIFLITLPIYFLAVFLISSLIYTIIDRPCMNYRKKFYK